MTVWVRFPRTALWHSYLLLMRWKTETLLQGVQRKTGTNPEFAASARTKVNYPRPSGLQLRHLFSRVCCIAFHYSFFLSAYGDSCFLCLLYVSLSYTPEDKLPDKAPQSARADRSLGIQILSKISFIYGLWDPWAFLLCCSSVLCKPLESSVLPNYLHRLLCFLSWNAGWHSKLPAKQAKGPNSLSKYFPRLLTLCSSSYIFGNAPHGAPPTRQTASLQREITFCLTSAVPATAQERQQLRNTACFYLL